MTARKPGARCQICGRRCRLGKVACPLCRDAFATSIVSLRELPARSA